MLQAKESEFDQARPWIERAAILFTHSASQLAHRWLPPPILRPLDDIFFASNLEADHSLWSRWRSFVTWAMQEADVFPWAASFRERYDRDFSRLLAVITRHLIDMQADGGRMILWGDPNYPPALAALNDPPLALMTLGDQALLKGRLVAVIGSRKASGHAVEQSFALGRGLAERDVTVVSGGALGCDIAAHAGVLAAARHSTSQASKAIPAIIVMAGGLARLYPQRNAAYFSDLAQAGALFVSERLWDSSCRPYDFPARNRIISGLCENTIVMQAAQRSGAMVTARLALDQGREVSVLAHPPGDVRASGSASLIADGACAFADAGDFLNTLNCATP